MIKEEYDWEQLEQEFENNVTVAFVGPSNDDRSSFFPNKFKNWNCLLVELFSSRESRTLAITVSCNNVLQYSNNVDFVTGMRSLIKSLFENFEFVIIDISSLQHSVIMYLSKLLFQEYKPLKLFATYAEPKEYNSSSTGDFKLNEEFLGLRAVPGFTKRNRGNKIKLVSMLGFDGDRLMKVLEETHDVETVVPVIGFPSFRPGWQARSLRNSKRVVEYNSSDVFLDVYKCGANSVFEAYELLNNLRPKSGETYALAPLGTRPHSLACAIYATRYDSTLILYDHPIEVIPRSEGVSKLLCYHLSSLILP